MRFKDLQQQQHLELNGFVVIKNVLSNQLIDQVSGYYFNELKENIELDFYTSNWIRDPEYLKKIHGYLNPLLAPIISDLLIESKSLYSYFLVKKPGDKGKVELHQDWALVDESYYYGMNVWIPLIDITQQNGVFRVMPGSHRNFHNIRGSFIDFPYKQFFDLMEEKYLQDVIVNKGDAIFFDHRLVHGSPPNKSNETRLALGHVVLPREAKVIHYNKPDAGSKKAIMYEADDDFLLNFPYGESPVGYKKIMEVPLPKDILSVSELESMV